MKETPVAEYRASEVALAELRQKYKDVVFPVETTAGDKEARAARLELVSTRTALESKRTELKAPILERGRILDAEAKRLTAEILALESPIEQQIAKGEKIREEKRKAKEAAEAARVTAIRRRIDGIRMAVTAAAGRDAAGLRGMWSSVNLMELPPADYEEFLEEAVAARQETLAALMSMYRAAAQAEKEAAARAAEIARLEALRVEQEAREAAARAEREAEEAKLQAARDELWRQQKALEDQRAAQAAEAKRLEDEAARQKAAADEAAADLARRTSTETPPWEDREGPTLAEGIDILRGAAADMGYTGPLSSEAVLNSAPAAAATPTKRKVSFWERDVVRLVAVQYSISPLKACEILANFKFDETLVQMRGDA